MAGKRARNRFSFSRSKTIVRCAVLVVFAVCMAAGLGWLASLIAPYSAYGRMVQTLAAPVYDWVNNIFADRAAATGSYVFYRHDGYLLQHIGRSADSSRKSDDTHAVFYDFGVVAHSDAPDAGDAGVKFLRAFTCSSNWALFERSIINWGLSRLRTASDRFPRLLIPKNCLMQQPSFHKELYIVPI